MDLSGLEAGLLPQPNVRASVAGDVSGTFATVTFDYAEPLTTVTQGCLARVSVVASGESVSVPSPSGEPRLLTLVAVPNVTVAARKLGDVRAGLLPDEKRCELMLGSDVLMPYALTIDPDTRRLRVSKSRPRDAYVEESTSDAAQNGPEEIHLIDVNRDPDTDWPMLAIRAQQDKAQVLGAFLLSLGATQSGVVANAAGEAALSPRSSAFDELPLPKTMAKPGPLAKVFDFESVELSPGFGLSDVSMQLIEHWPKATVLGVIGSDVWGHFRMTLDANAGVLVLKRPRVFSSGDHQRCAGIDRRVISEEACYELAQVNASEGVDLVVTLWRDLPNGGRMYLDLFDEKGEPIRSACQIGVTFPESDRGASARHRIPWDGLERAIPDCFAQLHAAKTAKLALFDEGELKECPGQCAFVHHLGSGQVSCECASGLAGMSQAEERFLEMYKDLLERAKKQQKQKADGGSPPDEENVPDEPPEGAP